MYAHNQARKKIDALSLGIIGMCDVLQNII